MAKQIKSHIIPEEEEVEKDNQPKSEGVGRVKDTKTVESKVPLMESDEIQGNLQRALEDSGNCFCADCNRIGKLKAIYFRKIFIFYIPIKNHFGCLLIMVLLFVLIVLEYILV